MYPQLSEIGEIENLADFPVCCCHGISYGSVMCASENVQQEDSDLLLPTATFCSFLAAVLCSHSVGDASSTLHNNPRGSCWLRANIIKSEST